MAVDAHYLLLSPPRHFSNRESMMISNNTIEANIGGFCTNNNLTGYGVVSPFRVTDNTPMYGSSAVDSLAYYADGANVGCESFHYLPTRKRSRDSILNNCYHEKPGSACVTSTSAPFSFLGQDMDISSYMINQQQQEIDLSVSLYMERVRMEIKEKRKKQAIIMMKAIEHRVAKRLRIKEEERERMGKINKALEERVKALTIENQTWRDLAQTNEATANNLRTNLEQLLAQVKELRNESKEEEDEAESCCGNSSEEKRMCRKCGEEESCVLLLPCRHLCLCGVCGSSVHTCPVCTSPKNASVHLNLSS